MCSARIDRHERRTLARSTGVRRARGERLRDQQRRRNGTSRYSGNGGHLSFLFANNVSGLKDDAATYCVGVGRRADAVDPSPALLAALADSPKVQPASACRIDERVVNAAGQPSLLFSLATIGCDGHDSCLFEGGYYEANLSASHGQYRARKVDGRWHVAPEGPRAIS